ncbi:MAG: hypothetical protein E7179_02370 [Erysipelotrichaceae bacterium]|nr:hypothetical protein [Erysipelotrichaceae bacterium]
MKQASEFYEELKDTFDYTCRSWLHMQLTQTTEEESRLIIGAAAFLFDNLFAKENAGADITKLVYEDAGNSYSGKKLSAKATSMRLAMSGDDFSLGTSPLREYVKWVGESEPDALTAYNDDYGKLALITIEELVNLLVEQEKDIPQLRIAELLFLNVIDLYFRFYKQILGEKAKGMKSAPCFLSVEEANQRIRSEISD